MIQADDLKLLAELGGIVNKYGADSFTRLASLLRNPEFADDMATALERVAETIPRRSSRKNPRESDRIGIGILNELRRIDPSKHAAVAEFREQLLSGAILKTMADLRRFAASYDLDIGNASSRKAAIVPLLRSISERETKEILGLVDNASESRSDDRSLEKWRELIVKPNSS